MHAHEHEQLNTNLPNSMYPSIEAAASPKKAHTQLLPVVRSSSASVRKKEFC
jgi:hypothetical protein